MELIAQLLFWGGVSLLALAYPGYPVLLAILVRLLPSHRLAPPEHPLPAELNARLPSLSVVLVARNEAARLPARLENLLACEYPADRREILIVSDGSDDRTPEALTPFLGRGVRLLTSPERQGKPAGLSRGLAAANGDIVVFADARQRFAPDVLARLAAWFVLHPQVGAVSGSLEIETSSAGAGQGVDAYWKLEKFIRAQEAALDSSVGCTGAIYAIRRALWREIPADTILDDVITPMRIAAQGHRVLFDPAAVAHDPQQLEPAIEKRRKRRTLAGNYQMLARHPDWCLPPFLGGHRLWLQLICHKYLRLLGPFLLAATLLGNILILQTHIIYIIAFTGQASFYTLALTGLALQGRVRAKLITLPAAFLFLNHTAFLGFLHSIRRRGPGW